MSSGWRTGPVTSPRIVSISVNDEHVRASLSRKEISTIPRDLSVL